MADMERISITIEPPLLERLDALVERTGHANRSELLRDLIRDRLVEERGDDEPVVGALAITYAHDRRELSDRLVHAAHDHHDLVLATLHVHLDEQHCLEVSALQGQRGSLRHYAEHVIGMKGVRHGGLLITSEAP